MYKALIQINKKKANNLIEKWVKDMSKHFADKNREKLMHLRKGEHPHS